MSDVTITIEGPDAEALRELLLDRPHREQWSTRVLAEIDASRATAAELHAIVTEPQSLRA